MRFLVIGGDGLLGKACKVRLEKAGHAVAVTSRRGGGIPLDLSDDLSGWIAPEGYDVALLLAAVSAIDICEEDRYGSHLVNVGNTILVAKMLLASGCRVVFPSTTLVFDDSVRNPDENAPTSPVTEYGRQKAEAEKLLLGLGGEVQVIRYSKVVPAPMPLFAQWRRKMLEGGEIIPFSDLFFSPIPLDYAVNASVTIAEAGLGGIWHVSGDEVLSYADAAAIIARDAGAPLSRVKPTTAEAVGVSLPFRVLKTTLDASRLKKTFGLVPPPAETTILEASHV